MCAVLATAQSCRTERAEHVFRQLSQGLLALSFVVSLLACGGGGGGGALAPPAGGSGGGGSGGGSGSLQWIEGVFEPASVYAARCEVPRSGLDGQGRPYPDQPGSLLHEKFWLRSFSHDLYLWYDEIIDRDPALLPTAEAYFDVLKTDALTPSGQPKDRFHFSADTEEWEQQAQSGVRAGYGARWVVLSTTVPRDVRVAFSEPGSPAAEAGVGRGARVLVVDGIDVVNTTNQAEIQAINAAVFSPPPGSTHTFTVELADGSEIVATLTAGNVTSTPVQNVRTFDTMTGTIGYLTFNDHIAPSEQQLIDAVRELAAAEIDELILDLRYNGGGFLTIASQLAYMVAGSAATAGRAFESLRFNDKHPTRNPVTGELLQPLPFRATTAAFSAFPSGQPLPSLGLSRLVVITGSNTCSASETIINALRGIDLEVIQIGNRTCGKPFGTYPADNCGTTWFTTMFQGVNDQGFGDYPDGFSPEGSSGILGVTLPGCPAADDLSQPLGSAEEARIAAALHFIETGRCPVAAAELPRQHGRVREGKEAALEDGLMPGPEWLRNRILLP